MSRKITWKGFHKWGGLIVAVFVLIFCLSGIVLNHREFFAPYSVSRTLLPHSYSIDKYNNGVIKGTIPLDGDSLLAFGSCGIWLTDRDFAKFTDFNTGLAAGVDRRNIKNIVKLADGNIWCAAQFGVYKYDGDKWVEVSLDGNSDRISDITLTSDSSAVVVLTRSEVFTLSPSGEQISRHSINAPVGMKQEYTMFKTFWMLHSGELFGVAGRIVVDIVAIIIVILCLTGIVLFVMPYRIKWHFRHTKEALAKTTLRFFKANRIVHDKVGYITIILTGIIAFTGMCLRPPLMIPLVLFKTAPVPFSAQDTDNFWQDRLRGIQWDDRMEKWLVSTSEGFIYVDSDFSGVPEIIESATPPVSPMGITVFEKYSTDEWMVGSFSGLYIWNTEQGSVRDYITGKDYDSSRRNFAVSSSLTTGMSRDLNVGDIVIFDYSKGNESLPTMPEELAGQPMSLWNAALELHVGRCYSPVLGPFSSLFVFVSGLMLTMILVSGLIIRTRSNKKQKNNKSNQKL